MITKICKKCLEEKNLDYFYKHHTTKDKKSPYCKSCDVERVTKLNLKRKLESKKTDKCLKCQNKKLDTNSFCLRHWIKGMIASNHIVSNNRELLINQLILKLEHFEYSCFYTNVLLIPGFNASIDHRIPRKKGGTDDINNLIWVHSGINAIKSSLSEKQFLRNSAKVLVEINSLGAI